MARLPNRIVYEFLEVAEVLAQQKGSANLQQAAMRRAISTAYYALFHALLRLLRWLSPLEQEQPGG